MTGQLSLGIIGHVDHGKTSLVKALTGMDTDRLKEEKERGMSIVLGFAYLAFEEGIVDMIDVPGHENFIRTMVSGATGIDAALLVVDANEGIKPQTVEHLAITRLVGVRQGLVAVTKSDLASPAAKAAVLRQVHTLLKGSPLEFAPVFFTSATTGEGLDDVRLALKGLLAARHRPPSAMQCWLPVDRVFSIAGRGTVVTGTMRLGRLRIGDEVEIMPHGRRAAVRQLEVHGREVDEVFPGQRAGVNLRNVKSGEIQRGDALATPGLLQPSILLDAEVSLLPEHKTTLRNGHVVRLLFGATDAVVHLRILSGPAIESGRPGIVQFRTLHPIAAVAGEPFILRTDSPARTIGGGRFLDPAPARHRRSDQAAMTRLQVLAIGSRDAVVLELLKAAGYGGLGIHVLAAKLGIAESEARIAAARAGAIMIKETLALHGPFLEALGEMVIAALEKFHRDQPLRLGAPLSYCRSQLPRSVSESVFKFLLDTLAGSKRIELTRGMMRLFGHDPMQKLCDKDRELASDTESRFRQGGATPPDVQELLQGDERRENIFHMLVERGALISLEGEQPGRKVTFHSSTVNEIDRRLCQSYPPPAQFTVSEARALLGSTRKFMVPLLEYFDRAGYTRRRGDKRIIVLPEERRR